MKYLGNLIHPRLRNLYSNYSAIFKQLSVAFHRLSLSFECNELERVDDKYGGATVRSLSTDHEL